MYEQQQWAEMLFCYVAIPGFGWTTHVTFVTASSLLNGSKC